MSCEVCGSPLKINATRFCSRACYGKATASAYARRRDAITRQCATCGVSFNPPTNSPRVTCSKECRYKLVSESHKEAGVRPLVLPTTESLRQKIKGPNAPWWKGGRSVNAKGYVLVIAPDGFPFPAMLDKSNRIKEHRMVMAVHLGRELKRSEVVHHIDGDRANNSIENLMLFASHAEHMRHHQH